jgi:hypothetical protein
MAAYPLRAAFAGVLLFVAGLAIAGGVWQVAREESQRLQGWRRADATVVELLKRRTIDGEVPVPLIAFTTATGDRISFTAPPNRNAPAYITGPVKVLYHPDHPQDAVIDSSERRWLRNGLAGAAALVLMCLGGYVAWYASRWDGTAPGPAA